MNMKVLGAFGAVLFVASSLSFAPAVHADAKSQQSAISVHGVGQGPMMCVDCEAPTPMSITLCHSSTVSVAVGGAPVGSFSTGQSTSACVTAPSVAPGSCIWMEYHYTCTRGGLFGLWQCNSTGANTKYGDNPYC